MKHWIYWMIAFGVFSNSWNDTFIDDTTDTDTPVIDFTVSVLIGASWPIMVGVYLDDAFGDQIR